jgi:hypothetical protein
LFTATTGGKYTFSAIFEISEKAEVINQWFGRTVAATRKDAKILE